LLERVRRLGARVTFGCTASSTEGDYIVDCLPRQREICSLYAA
jgi:hypothetical protein